MAKRKAKQSKEEVLLAKKTRILKARHIAFICAEINSKRLPNGRLRRGEINKALKEHKTVSPWITIDLIKKGLKKDYAQPVATNIVSKSQTLQVILPTMLALQPRRSQMILPHFHL